ncbi:MAG: hypothetical protein IPN79_18555 [Saprospiraceae bacterium]|nr:hypothetical protein [Saprospiraceae bacterium]
MVIRVLFYFTFVLGFCYCKQINPDIRKFTYCTNEQEYCLISTLDTVKLKGHFLQHFKAYTVIREYDTILPISYTIAFGNSQVYNDYNPFNTYSYDTTFVRNKLSLKYNKPPVYFITLENYNKKEYITVCRELPGMGIIVESNYYSDTLKILFETTYWNEYNFSKVNLEKHYEILKNSVVVKK